MRPQNFEKKLASSGHLFYNYKQIIDFNAMSKNSTSEPFLREPMVGENRRKL
jgi:hypothetical protein